jgi:hypothetical protein
VLRYAFPREKLVPHWEHRFAHVLLLWCGRDSLISSIQCRSQPTLPGRVLEYVSRDPGTMRHGSQRRRPSLVHASPSFTSFIERDAQRQIGTLFEHSVLKAQAIERAPAKA